MILDAIRRAFLPAKANIDVRVQVISPKPGDFLIVSFDQRISSDMAGELSAELKKSMMDGVKFVILSGGKTDITLVQAPELHKGTEIRTDGSEDKSSFPPPDRYVFGCRG